MSRRRPGRTLRLGLERLEGRDLPTSPVLLAGPVGLRRGDVASSLRSTGETPRIPTPRELARQRFTARFAGSFVTGAGRFTDQASETYVEGGGISSAFLHGDLQMVVSAPVDPAGEATGTAVLIVKNVTNSGNLLVLDLRGDASSLDRSGRPTRLRWTVGGASGGTFSESTGEGTVEIRYRPGGKLPPRATSAGNAGVVFRGRIETNGVYNLLR